jgi:hypothetical protein
MGGLLHAFHVPFESWINLQNESVLTINMCVGFLIPSQDSNQEPHTIQGASLPSALSMFNIHRLKGTLFVCKYITYFQTWIYFRTEPLTRLKFSHYVWTGFCGATGDGKWSHHKSLSI